MKTSHYAGSIEDQSGGLSFFVRPNRYHLLDCSTWRLVPAPACCHADLTHLVTSHHAWACLQQFHRSGKRRENFLSTLLTGMYHRFGEWLMNEACRWPRCCGRPWHPSPDSFHVIASGSPLDAAGVDRTCCPRVGQFPRFTNTTLPRRQCRPNTFCQQVRGWV